MSTDTSRFYNYTPHAVTVFESARGSATVEFASVGELRLVAKEQRRRGYVQRVNEQGTMVTFDIVEPPQYESLAFGNGTPWTAESTAGKRLIVSALAAKFLAQQTEALRLLGTQVFAPATDSKFAVRTDKGAIAGTTALEQYV